MFFFEFNLISLIISLAIIIFVYGQWRKNYFEKRGVKCLPYRFSATGNIFKVLIKQEHMINIIKKAYCKFSDQKYFGFMQMGRPMIVVKDLDLIKQITVKDFDSFQDHHGFVSEDIDPLFGKNLFALKAENWREMRATLSPAFTSNKMRLMFELVTDRAKLCADYYFSQTKEKQNMENGYIEVELKNLFTRYGTDTIASTAFGLQIDSFNDSDQEFYNMSKIASNIGGIQYIKILFCTSFPRIMKFLGVTLYNEKINNFFSTLVTSTMKEREDKNIFRPDMIHLLMQARKGALEYEQEDSKDAGYATVEESSIGKQAIKKQWNNEYVTAQVLLFLLAGFDTVPTTLSFFGYEMATRPEIQKRLQNEIDEIIREKGWNLDYTDLTRLKYLDMTLSENMRLWPQATVLDRICTKTYNLPPPNNESSEGYIMELNKSIYIPIYCIHRDSKYYENPDLFDPERFSDENKHKIDPFAYMPFGTGPRNCIGSRFALMEMKAIIFFMLAKFNFVVTPKTSIPLVMSKTTLSLDSQNGFWIGLQPRKQ